MATKKKVLVVAKSNLPKVKEAVSTEVVISSIEDKAKGSFAKLKKIDKIVTQQDVELASNQVKLLKELAKEAKTQKEGITNPIYEAVEKIEALFKPFEDKVKKADADIKILIEDFIARNNKQLEQVQEDFKNNKIKKVSTYTEKTNELQIKSTGAAKFKKITKMFITDTKKIPDKFWVINETAVEVALKNGEKVPGAELRKIDKVAI